MAEETGTIADETGLITADEAGATLGLLMADETGTTAELGAAVGLLTTRDGAQLALADTGTDAEGIGIGTSVALLHLCGQRVFLRAGQDRTGQTYSYCAGE